MNDIELRNIPNYEGLYAITSSGQVWSYRKKDFLRPTERAGYPYVVLTKNGKQAGFSIHRLVAQAFIPNPDNLPIVNHKDENKQNNNVDNLEWCDYQHNNTYGSRIDKVNQKISHKTYQYDLDGNLIAVWPSQREASRQLNISSGNINDVIKGKLKSTHGFIFTDTPIDKSQGN